MTTSDRRPDAVVIGAGFAGLAAAIRLARLGRRVTVLERHDEPGGRARMFRADGFTFDMGPSWYWMPDVFEEFFRMAGTEVDDHLSLVRLDPSYRVFFDEGPLDVPAGRDGVRALFDRVEPGAGRRLDAFLDEGRRKYRLGMEHFVWRPGNSPLEFADPRVLPEVLRLSLFGSLSAHVRRHFTDPRLVRLLEFPVLFLGARSERTPALYSMMNHADTDLGTWYPMGGMYRVVDAMVSVARGLGVEFLFGAEVDAILERNGSVSGVSSGGSILEADVVISAADYHHAEQDLLPSRWRRYDRAYWRSRTMAPGSLLFFLGIDCRMDGLLHHNLFFDTPFEPHAHTIYDDPAWPGSPNFYVCVPSRTDPTLAPDGCENLFVLVPLAAGLDANEHETARLFDHVMDRIGERTGLDPRAHVVYRRDYAHREFEEDFHAWRGNAYGLANTLRQTAFMKPRMRSRLPGLYFAGQLTTPGPGVPPSLISGQVAAMEADRWLQTRPQSTGP